MKITLVSHANSKIDQIESLKRQFDIHVFRPGDSLSFYDLVIFDANQAENILCTETASPWMVINEKSIHHTLKYFQAGACAVLDQLYPVENFSRCLKKISSGHLYIEPEIMQILAMRQIHKH